MWKMRKDKFSLVELLVVIAVISMLASLLLPALNRAKEMAKSISCANNLKQVGIAYECYMSDNDGYLQPIFGSPSFGPPYWNHGLLQWNPNDAANHNPQGYLTIRTLLCPSLPYSLDFWRYQTSYGVNMNLIYYSANPYSSNEYTSGRAARIMTPSIKFFINDTAQCSDGSGGTYGDRGFWRWDGSMGTSFGLPSARHSGHSVNMLHLDGHVAAVQPANRAIPTNAAPFKWGDVAGSQRFLDVLDKRW